MSVEDQTKSILGITCVVVEDIVKIDGQITEKLLIGMHRIKTEMYGILVKTQRNTKMERL